LEIASLAKILRLHRSPLALTRCRLRSFSSSTATAPLPLRYRTQRFSVLNAQLQLQFYGWRVNGCGGFYSALGQGPSWSTTSQPHRDETQQVPGITRTYVAQFCYVNGMTWWSHLSLAKQLFGSTQRESLADGPHVQALTTARKECWAARKRVSGDGRTRPHFAPSGNK
jgi:hypothetical protein